MHFKKQTKKQKTKHSSNACPLRSEKEKITEHFHQNMCKSGLGPNKKKRTFFLFPNLAFHRWTLRTRTYKRKSFQIPPGFLLSNPRPPAHSKAREAPTPGRDAVPHLSCFWKLWDLRWSQGAVPLQRWEESQMPLLAESCCCFSMRRGHRAALEAALGLAQLEGNF